MEYAFSRSDNQLDRKDWGPDYPDALVAAGRGGALLKQMVWILQLINSLPESIQSRLSPGLALVLWSQRVRVCLVLDVG